MMGAQSFVTVTGTKFDRYEVAIIERHQQHLDGGRVHVGLLVTFKSGRNRFYWLPEDVAAIEREFGRI